MRCLTWAGRWYAVDADGCLPGCVRGWTWPLGCEKLDAIDGPSRPGAHSMDELTRKATEVVDAQGPIEESLRRVVQDSARWNEFSAALARSIELAVRGS